MDESNIAHSLGAPKGIEEKYATFALLGEPGEPQRHMEMHFAGAVGAGKTSALMDAAGITLLRYPNSQNAMVRDIEKYLTTSTLNTFMERWRPMFEDGTFKYVQHPDNVVRNQLNGAEMYLFGLDNPRTENRLVGSEWFRVFIDQAERVSESIVNQVFLRLRQVVYHKDGIQGFNYIKAASNWDKGRNWIWKRCIPQSVRITPDMYERRVEAEIGSRKVTAYRLYIEARYGENQSVNRNYDQAIALAGRDAKRFISDAPPPEQGIIWPEFDEEIHVYEHTEDFEGLPLYVGLDSGSGGPNHPTYAAFVTLDRWGTADVVGEYMYPLPSDDSPQFRTPKANAQALSRRLMDYKQRGVDEFRVYADFALWERERDGKSAADDYLQVLAELPFPVAFLPANKARRGSIARGNDAIRDRLGDETPFGTPRLRVSRRDAPNALEALATITYDNVDRDTWGIVDVYDGLRYVIMNLPTYGWPGSSLIDQDKEDYQPAKLVWRTR